MEHQCLKNRDVVNEEDRISELPEALLLHILSSLPTETVVATSGLSKRWRSLWKIVPYLKFHSEKHKSEHHSFSEIVFRSLLSHEAPVLESLHLVVEDKAEALDVGIWIGIAFARNLRKLVLDIHSEYVSARLPSVLWSYNNTLETLELYDSILLDIPSSVCLKSLRTLHLDYVIFSDEKSISNLFCGCTGLEVLFVNRKSNIDVETFTIAVPSLQRLTVIDEFAGEGVAGYVINCPSLKYLEIRGFEWLELCLIENMPELVEAKVFDVSYINNENIFVSLTSVKRLSLHLSPFEEIKYPTGIIFHQLVYLELLTQKGWTLLPLMLDSSPKLQILKLNDPSRFAKQDHPAGWEWSQPKSVPECLLFHLETFVWTRYEWQREDEKEVALYIIKNARRLKKAFIATKHVTAKDVKLLEKRREMVNQLATEARALNSCHLVFECEKDPFN